MDTLPVIYTAVYLLVIVIFILVVIAGYVYCSVLFGNRSIRFSGFCCLFHEKQKFSETAVSYSDIALFN